MDLFVEKNLKMPYSELIKICQSINIQMTNQQIDQVQKDTIAQSSGTNVFKHSAGRIGASQSKAAAHSDQALSSQSLIQRICYPELHKVNTKAVLHGCQHEASAICAFEESLEELFESSNVVSLLIKSILGCMLPQIFYAHVIGVGKVVEILSVPSV